MITPSSHRYPLFDSEPTPSERRLRKRTDFLLLVAHLEHSMAHVSTGTWLVAVQNPTLFAATLVACWNKGLTPLVSTDLQPGTLQELEPRLDGVLCDTPLETSLETVVVTASGAPSASVPTVVPSFPGQSLAIIMFTSGTTGARKEVRKTFASLLEEVRTLHETFGAQVGELPRFATVSHFHIYGLLFNVLWPLYSGQEIGSDRMFYWEEVFARASEKGGCIVSSPAHLRFLADIAERTEFQGQSFVIFSSGGPLTPDVAQHIERAGLPAPIEVFGSTETGGVAYRTQGVDSDGLFTPLSRVEVKCDADAHLLLRSPWLDDVDFWTATGDTARMDGERFALCGRFDRIVKIAGKRVSIAEMETLLRGNPAIDDVRVFQATGDSGGTRSSLAVVAAMSHEPLSTIRRGKEARMRFVKDCKELLLSRFEPVTLPRQWRFVEQLPVDSQGKTTVVLLEELLAHG